MVLLAFRRDTLTHRNRRIPTRLPAVWGRLGHPLRAEALARSLPDPDRRARALAALSEALAEDGTDGRAATGPGVTVVGAVEVADEAEAAARSVTGAAPRAQTLAQVAEAWAELGHTDRAKALADEAERLAWSDVGDAYETSQAVQAVARTWARLGAADRVEALDLKLGALSQERNWSSTVDALPPWVLTLARALARSGEVDRAETVARGITNAQEMVLTRLEQHLDQRGYGAPDGRRAHGAEEASIAIGEPELWALALAEVAQAGGRATPSAPRPCWQRPRVSREPGRAPRTGREHGPARSSRWYVAGARWGTSTAPKDSPAAPERCSGPESRCGTRPNWPGKPRCGRGSGTASAPGNWPARRRRLLVEPPGRGSSGGNWPKWP